MWAFFVPDSKARLINETGNLKMFNHTKPRYSIRDLLSLLNIGRAGLYSEINAGRLRTYKVGNRRFADPDDLDRYIKITRQEAPE